MAQAPTTMNHDMHDDMLIAQAAAVLKAGGLVGMPTETVYGLAADASSAAAIARIYAAKGRPSDHPVIWRALNKSATGRSIFPRKPGFSRALSGPDR